MAQDWAPPALSESFIWDGGLWQKWGSPPAGPTTLQRLRKKKAKGVLGRMRGRLMLNCWGAVWWRAEFTGNNSRGPGKRSRNRNGHCVLKGLVHTQWGLQLPLVSSLRARCQNHWESFKGAHAPQKDSIWSTWGFHCPPGHPGTCCWPTGNCKETVRKL